MERDLVAGSCNSPPYFDGNNYAAWREKFEIFLNALDEYASEYLTKDWAAPVKTVESNVVPKPRSEWTDAEIVEMITNEAMSLGQPIEELLIVQKILRVLPSRFRAKKTAIMEVQNCSPVFAFTPVMEGRSSPLAWRPCVGQQSFMFSSRFVRLLSGQNCSFFSLKGTEVAVLRGLDELGIALRALFCLSRTLHEFAEVSTSVKTQTLLVLAFAEPNL
ncbi:hypothetical protein L3X38_040642 [Prunus dulcis]|uniref:DUF4219 domain-containing protein n=1 Tax=Prunus dulcis TaxID=3755 RepID=A0AAD4YTP5_PRUDU|nr:hypothetical protein L3X38_040642 [Prunus dulcis]